MYFELILERERNKKAILTWLTRFFVEANASRSSFHCNGAKLAVEKHQITPQK